MVACQEQWRFDDVEAIQRLDGLIALCTDCRHAQRIGEAFVNGSYDQAREHLAAVNGWSNEETEHYLRASLAWWEERSTHDWTLDLRVLDTISDANDGPIDVPVEGDTTAATNEAVAAVEKIGKGVAVEQGVGGDDAVGREGADDVTAPNGTPPDDGEGGQGRQVSNAAESVSPSSPMRPEEVSDDVIRHVIAEESVEHVIPPAQLGDLARGWFYARRLDDLIEEQRSVPERLEARSRILRDHGARMVKLEEQLKNHLRDLYPSAKEARAAEARFRGAAHVHGIDEAARRLRDTPEQLGRMRRWRQLGPLFGRGHSSGKAQARLAAATAQALFHRRKEAQALIEKTRADPAFEAVARGEAPASEKVSGASAPRQRHAGGLWKRAQASPLLAPLRGLFRTAGDSGAAQESSSEVGEASGRGVQRLIDVAGRLEARARSVRTEIEEHRRERSLFVEAEAFAQADRFLSTIDETRWTAAKARAREAVKDGELSPGSATGENRTPVAEQASR